ncbi:MAG: undecaprenyldiphospho-muramoylpentapeptide beta-N-acetylglucosaminyltransferase [Deltaproteobacteria bacterium]|nr:undecaprenyldiphospho-muramoylpentapeptide beta-N-acetylglucosaminyltransferase [Deltaproteobacteria bacterium]
MTLRVVVAGGGTGGHLFPGIAVVQELRRRQPECEVTFVGTERGIEARVLPERGEHLEVLDVTPLKGRSPSELWRSMMRLPSAMMQAAQIVRGADLVIGVGGYASGPVVAAAAMQRIPTAILEQNAHVGLTNRMLAKLVGRAFLSFEETAPLFGSAARVVGNPVRRPIAAMAKRASADPDGFESRAETILVMGGSQGARALNLTAPEAFAKLANPRKVIHQTGAAMVDEVQARYDELGVDAEAVAFIDDMARAYASAAVVVARAGATTLAELQAIGRPSVLIPYPFAADDHQAVNARSLESAGAARCILETDLDADTLANAVDALLGDPAEARAMAAAARGRGKPEAAAAIVDELVEWLALESVATSVGFEPTGDDESEGVERRRLRGYGSYQPVLVGRSATARSITSRRPLVFA